MFEFSVQQNVVEKSWFELACKEEETGKDGSSRFDATVRCRQARQRHPVTRHSNHFKFKDARAGLAAGNASRAFLNFATDTHANHIERGAGAGVVRAGRAATRAVARRCSRLQLCDLGRLRFRHFQYDSSSSSGRRRAASSREELRCWIAFGAQADDRRRSEGAMPDRSDCIWPTFCRREPRGLRGSRPSRPETTCLDRGSSRSESNHACPKSTGPSNPAGDQERSAYGEPEGFAE